MVLIGYLLGFLVNGFCSGSAYKQAFFPRTSPHWRRVMLFSAGLLPCTILSGVSCRRGRGGVRGNHVAVGGGAVGVAIPVGNRLLSALLAAGRGAAAARSGDAAGQNGVRQSALSVPHVGNPERDPRESVLQPARRAVRGERDSAVRLRVHRGVLRVRLHLEL